MKASVIATRNRRPMSASSRACRRSTALFRCRSAPAARSDRVRLPWGMPTGQRLPSVRELAERAGIAHMTVATVYTGTARGRPHRGEARRRHLCRRRAQQRRPALSCIRKIQRRIETLFNEAEQLVGAIGRIVAGQCPRRARPDADTAPAPRDGGQFRRNDAAICQPYSGLCRLRRYHRRHDGRRPARGRIVPCPATSA